MNSPHGGGGTSRLEAPDRGPPRSCRERRTVPRFPDGPEKVVWHQSPAIVRCATLAPAGAARPCFRETGCPVRLAPRGGIAPRARHLAQAEPTGRCDRTVARRPDAQVARMRAHNERAPVGALALRPGPFLQHRARRPPYRLKDSPSRDSTARRAIPTGPAPHAQSRIRLHGMPPYRAGGRPEGASRWRASGRAAAAHDTPPPRPEGYRPDARQRPIEGGCPS